MQISILNGPNLNLLGKRQPDHYGQISFEDYLEHLKTRYPNIRLSYFQSNSEYELIEVIQQHGFSSQGIVLNAGAFTHSSIAIADAIAAVPAPVIEVHISNVFAREVFRHQSFITGNCRGSISGLGMDVYRLAVEAIIEISKGSH